MSIALLADDQRERLREALRQLSLVWIDGLEWLRLADEAPVACWGLDLLTGEEVLALNPRVLEWNPQVLALVLKHELLHRAAYGYAWNLPQDDVANLALDIVVNFILWTDNPSVFDEMSQVVYAECSGLVLLAAGPSWPLGGKLRALQRCIWEARSPENPVSLYYLLVDQADKRHLCLPFTATPSAAFAPHCIRKDAKAAASERKLFRRESAFGRAVQRVAASAVQSAKKRRWHNLPFSVEQVVPAATANASDVARLLAYIRTRQVAVMAAQVLLAAEARETVYQWLGMRPDRATQVLMAAGIVPDLLPMSGNEVPQHARPTVAAYVDTSGSLLDSRDLIVGVVREVQAWLPATVFVFADHVCEVSLAEIANGVFHQGGGTNFVAVFEHFEHHDAEAALMLTDGWGSAPAGWKTRLAKRGKRLYVAFVDVQPGPPLTEIAVGWTRVHKG